MNKSVLSCFRMSQHPRKSIPIRWNSSGNQLPIIEWRKDLSDLKTITLQSPASFITPFLDRIGWRTIWISSPQRTWLSLDCPGWTSISWRQSEELWLSHYVWFRVLRVQARQSPQQALCITWSGKQKDRSWSAPLRTWLLICWPKGSNQLA